MTEMYSKERPEVMYALDMTDRVGTKDEVFGGNVVKHDETKRGHKYALVEGDIPHNGQKFFRLYDGRHCTFIPTETWPKRNHYTAGFPAVGERVTFALIPDRFRADAMFISSGGPEVQYLSATKRYRFFGNTNWRYRLAEASDLEPGTELLMVKIARLSPCDDPAHDITFTIRIADSEKDNYVRYDIVAPQPYEGCFVPKDRFLATVKSDYYDDEERVAYILPLGSEEVARRGCVCVRCGLWVPDGQYHSHY